MATEKNEDKSKKSSDEVSDQIQRLAQQLLSKTDDIKSEVDRNKIQEGITALQESVQAVSMAAQSSQARIIPYDVKSNCGCEQTRQATCCKELFITGVQVVQGQGLPELKDRKQLELIVAVHMPGSSGVAPGIAGNIGVNLDGGWVHLNTPMGKICVSCKGCTKVPLRFEGREVEDMATGGRAEFGSNQGHISLFCDCNEESTTSTVRLGGGGVTGGVIEIEVTARNSSGCCC